MEGADGDPIVVYVLKILRTYGTLIEGNVDLPEPLAEADLARIGAIRNYLANFDPDPLPMLASLKRARVALVGSEELKERLRRWHPSAAWSDGRPAVHGVLLVFADALRDAR